VILHLAAQARCVSVNSDVMQLAEKSRPSDLRLVATGTAVAAFAALFFAWRVYALGSIPLGSCASDRHPALCEFGRWMLQLLPSEARHMLMAVVLVAVAVLFGWISIRLVKRSEEIDLEVGKGGRGLK
jgi:hypothetical protein